MLSTTVVFIGYPAYGDYLSTNAMVRTLARCYSRIVISCQKGHEPYVQTLFHDLTDRVTITPLGHDDLIAYLLSSRDDDVVNYSHVSWTSHFQFAPYIHPSCRQFSSTNKEEWVAYLSQLLQDSTGVLLPLGQSVRPRNNTEAFYTTLHMDPSLATTAFRFVRDAEKEEACRDHVLQRFGLTTQDRYIIVNQPPEERTTDTEKPINRKHFRSPHVMNIINIFNLVDNPLHLPLLVEGAEEIHTIENSNALFLYFLQVTGSMSRDKTVHVHLYARTRGAWMWDMYRYPELSNWVFLLE